MLKLNEEETTLAIQPGDVWHRRYSVSEPTFLHLVVEQIGTDLSILLDSEGDPPPFKVDSPIGSQGEEELVAILEPSIPYRVRIIVNDGSPPGDFRFRTAAQRPAAEADRARVRADRDHRLGWAEKNQDEALEHYRRALKTWRALNLPRREAETLDCMAQAYLAKKKPEVAVALLDRAIERGRPLSTQHDRTRLITFLDRAGTVRRRDLHQPERAIDEYLDEAVSIAQLLNNRNLLSSALHHRGKALFDLGSLQSSLNDLEMALLHQGESEYSSQEILILKDKTAALLALNNSAEAYETAKETRALALQRRVALEANSAQIQMARAQAQLGQLASAEELATEAVSALRKIHNAARLVNGLQALGDIHRRLGDLRGARSAFSEALRIVRTDPDVAREGGLLIELGYLEIASGSPQLGLEHLDSALATFRELGDLRSQASALTRGAEALRDLGRLDEAWMRIQPALAAVEGLRATTVREDVRVGFFEFRQEYYDIALDILIRRWRLEPTSQRATEALRLHDRRLAREFRDHRQALEQANDLPNDHFSDERERSLEEALASAASSDDQADEQTTARIDRLLAELAKVRGEKRHNRVVPHPPPEPLDLDDLQRELSQDETLLLIFALCPSGSYLWTLGSPEGLTLVELSMEHQHMSDLVASWTATLKSSNGRQQARQRDLGRTLSQALLAPIATQLGSRRLALVLDGALHALPFAALPDPREEGQYLVESAEIVSLPSASALAQLRGRAGSSNNRVAAFVDPVYDVNDSRIEGEGRPSPQPAPGGPSEAGSAEEAKVAKETQAAQNLVSRVLERNGNRSLASLPGSAREGEALLARASGAENLLFRGFEATADRVRTLPLGDFYIVHFALHAFADSERPDLSGLIFSMVDKAGRPRNGFLRGFEIAGLDFSAQLVVLSACETYTGKNVRGEGILSLARRFFDAGAFRVLASRWKVNDRQTAKLMNHFYEGLLVERRGPGSALRQAQLALLEDPATEAPYFWAAFTLEGDWRGFSEGLPNAANRNRREDVQ